MSAPLSALLFSLVLGAPAPEPVRSASFARGVAAPADASPRGRLWQLLTAGATENTPRPTSPRYLALESPGLRGFGLYIAWSLPALAPDDERVLEAVASTLGGDEGWLVARVVRAGKADAVNVWCERREGAAWFGVEVTGTKRSSTKELELIVLETLAVLSAHAPPLVEEKTDTDAPVRETQAKASEPSVGLSPALAGRTVRRLLPPASRAVIEVQPPDAPGVPRVTKAPIRHVVEKGDTLTHIARRNGLDLDDALVNSGMKSSTNYQPTWQIVGWAPRGDLQPKPRTAPTQAVQGNGQARPQTAPATGSTRAAPPQSTAPAVSPDDF